MLALIFSYCCFGKLSWRIWWASSYTREWHHSDWFLFPTCWQEIISSVSWLILVEWKKEVIRSKNRFKLNWKGVVYVTKSIEINSAEYWSVNFIDCFRICLVLSGFCILGGNCCRSEESRWNLPGSSDQQINRCKLVHCR